MIFPEVKIYQPDVYTDLRGDLLTLWNRDYFNPPMDFKHDKISTSSQYVLRGMHGDNKSWKLTSCLHGEMYFVVVDNRIDSPNYLKWDSIILDDKTRKQVLTPPNFAIGFMVLSDIALLHYKWAYPGNYPDVDKQFTLKWNDPKINISWPIENPLLSLRDNNAKLS
jgi:dTDP-4-dehydrorhamnose 3,5-epimerase